MEWECMWLVLMKQGRTGPEFHCQSGLIFRNVRVVELEYCQPHVAGMSVRFSAPYQLGEGAFNSGTTAHWAAS
ncbi:hypothetical protein TSO5_19770 [Azospirillum sp. TSO5]|nr:hypothetical protein TSO5_19770 [Azospirillum sp. TSO5]